MNSFTRCACMIFSRVSLPKTCVLTGPSGGINSFNACAWNCTIASDKSGWYTPHAPLNGLVRSSIEKPSSSKPLAYCFSHSSREDLSASNSIIKSCDKLLSTSSGKTSARFASNGTSASSSSPRLTVTPPSSSNSISISGRPSISTSTSTEPCGRFCTRSTGITVP